MHIIILDNESCIFKEYQLPPSTTVEKFHCILMEDGLFNDTYQFLSINGEELMKNTWSRSIGSFVCIMDLIESPLVINIHTRSMVETNENILILSRNYGLHMKKCMVIMEKTIALMKAASDGFLIDCKKKEKEIHESPIERKRDKNETIPSNIDVDDLTMAEFSLQPGNFDEGTYCDNDTVNTSLSHMFNNRNQKHHQYFQTKVSSFDLEHELTDTDRLRLLSFDENHNETVDAELKHQKWYIHKLNRTKNSFARFLYRYKKIKRLRKRV